MKKNNLLITAAAFFAGAIALAGCNGNSATTIEVCASDNPHAKVLNECVKGLLAEKGYDLKVTVLDWSEQNQAVSDGDYDANYFQHVPFLSLYEGTPELFAACKVHYEPLGIYSDSKTTLGEGTFEICDDTSNGVRALELLAAKGVISADVEGDNYPIATVNNEDGSTSTAFGSTLAAQPTWTNRAGTVTITKIAEENLAASMADYDYACLPCNTAYTGNVPSSKRVAVEDDPTQVEAKANIIAARKADYKNDADYKAKIDALCDAMLSEEVSQYFNTTFLGAMTCDSSTQIDLRASI